MSCAPPEGATESNSGCTGLPVPAPGVDGPRQLIGDVLGIGPVAVTTEKIYFARGGRGEKMEICRFVKERGELNCFANVDPFDLQTLDVASDGTLLGLVMGPLKMSVLARIHETTSGVEYQPFLEEGEWMLTLNAGAPHDVCAVVGRPGPGHADRALIRVPMAGGPRSVLVPFGHVQGDAVACDATDAYFTGDSGLERVPLHGGTPVTLGTSAFQIALGPHHVYVAGIRGIERLSKGSTALTLVAPVAHSGLGWNPVRKLLAFPGGVAWSERTFPHERPDELASVLRRCRDPEGCEAIVASPSEITLEAADDGMVYWTELAKTRYGEATVLYAARGPKKLAIAREATAPAD